MSFALGYGTNGFANHRLDDALRIIADLGYRSVALTLDHHHLDPFAADVVKETGRVAGLLSSLGLRCVVETGARYLLDPARKHHPTLVSGDTAVRIDFLHRAIRIAADLGADCVSFWSGIKPSDVDDETAHQRMLSGVGKVLVEADRRRVRIGLEPEPGMHVQHLAQALALRAELGDPEMLGITLDVGHCVAVEPVNAAECVRQAAGLLVNVQLDDMRPGVHEHLEFGEGDLDLPGTLAALAEAGYTGVAAVELPRHSHAAPDVARRAFAALTAAMPLADSEWVGEVDHPWLVDAERRVRAEPAAVRALFPAVGRKVGRQAMRPEIDPQGLIHGTVDDLARTRLLAALAGVLPAAELAAEVTELYRYGDDAERRGVLRGLTTLPPTVVEAGLGLVQDALRTNDIRLVAAALGPFAGEHLDQHSWRHGVLKCLFVGVPLAAVAAVDRRTDPELLRMIADYADERRAAGREVPADAVRLLETS
ncbi:EboA domain-containing protein [Kibdelosporangium phytohabitans]|uniref:Sugar phosphate isomerase n=1 Tax=Kibdelosporangium phytohabitans TaxID=860235 RepID=A0A0N7F4C7_9PSEU|nr:EboA domain-containing protein [Kibdelosporangium phytohabitans]ALG11063.1 sugar phosphate isomerase [Kibdelosporangium phytohabitans]MBE1462297.1 sugar phosphate isomerase/epimerase [Kibdelosporangium phytohabitans]